MDADVVLRLRKAHLNGPLEVLCEHGGVYVSQMPQWDMCVLQGNIGLARLDSLVALVFFFSGRRRHTSSYGDWSSDVCSSDLVERLRQIDQLSRGRIQTVMSSALAIERLVLDADLVVGAVLVPGARAPHLVGAELRSEERRVGKDGRARLGQGDREEREQRGRV